MGATACLLSIVNAGSITLKKYDTEWENGLEISLGLVSKETGLSPEQAQDSITGWLESKHTKIADKQYTFVKTNQLYFDDGSHFEFTFDNADRQEMCAYLREKWPTQPADLSKPKVKRQGRRLSN